MTISNRRWVCATLLSLAASALALPSHATDVALVGRIGNSAILSIDGGAPRTVKPGTKTREGVELLSLNGASAVVSVDGQRLMLRLGAQPIEVDGRQKPEVTLYEDGRGHFTGVALIDGARIPFIVDTGATLLSLGRSHAERIGLDHRGGTEVSTQTASGVVKARRVRLSSVQIGEIRMQGVDALVMANDLPIALLGMSVLGQLEIVRKAGQMTLR